MACSPCPLLEATTLDHGILGDTWRNQRFRCCGFPMNYPIREMTEKKWQRLESCCTKQHYLVESLLMRLLWWSGTHKAIPLAVLVFPGPSFLFDQKHIFLLLSWWYYNTSWWFCGFLRSLWTNEKKYQVSFFLVIFYLRYILRTRIWWYSTRARN